MSTNNKQKTLIISGLTSTAGIFIAKAIGIIYVIPFNSLVGEGNLYLYTYAYTVYEYMILIAAAGFPFAISMAVAKYYTLEDFISIKLIKKIGFSLLTGLGLISMVFVVIASPFFASIMAPPNAASIDLNKLSFSIILVASALVVVPILSFYRGYYQGLKEFKSNAYSQIIEQIIRVIFILALGYTCVYIFNTDRVVPVYLAIFSATFAALMTVFYYVKFDRAHRQEIDQLAAKQTRQKRTMKELTKELFIYALPFVLLACITNANGIINASFYAKAMAARGESVDFIQMTFSMLYFTCNKLTSIPQVLSIGFTMAIVPYLTSSYVLKDRLKMKTQMNEALSVTTYICIPLVFCLIVMSLPIYYTVYGGDNYLLGGEVLKWAALLGISDTIFPSASSFMDATRLRRVHLGAVLVGLLFKLCATYPAIYYFGYGGSMATSAITTLIVFVIDLVFIYRNYRIGFAKFLKNLGIITLGVGVMFLTYGSLQLIGLDFIYNSRMLNFGILAIYGIATCLSYAIFTAFFKVPQSILHINFQEIWRKISKKWSFGSGNE